MARSALTVARTRDSVLALVIAVGLPSAVTTILGGAYLAAGTAMAALPPVPIPPENPITEEKRILGKILFWDEQLSSSNAVACATCHAPRANGGDPRVGVNNAPRNPGPDGLFNTADDIFGSPGIIQSDLSNDYTPNGLYTFNVQVTGRLAPSMINAAYAPDLFWDGRASTTFTDPVSGDVLISWSGALESQSVGPPMSPVEMNHGGMNWGVLTGKVAQINPLDLATNVPADVAVALADHPSYPDLFQRAFGTPDVSAARIAFAIATYERTLISDQTPYDAWIEGDENAMTENQISGFVAFIDGNSACTACHSVNQDLFTDHLYHNLGLRPSSEDIGRQAVTGNAADAGKFRTPGLRNIGLRSRFMHNGAHTSLEEVVRFYAQSEGAPPQFTDNLDPFMVNISIQAPDQAAMVDFMKNALTDPRVANETFPFDRPTLAAERAEHRVVAVAETAGNAGSGGFIPGAIVSSPPLIGALDFRIGLQNALAGAPAMLAFSFDPPVDGQITTDFVAYSSTTMGIGPGGGFATAHIPLDTSGPLGALQGGDVVYAQWFVLDPAAPGGTAYSQVLRVPVFCGGYGCPTVCLADMDQNGGIDGADLGVFFGFYETGDAAADLDQNGGIDGGDLATFMHAYETGC